MFIWHISQHNCVYLSHVISQHNSVQYSVYLSYLTTQLSTAQCLPVTNLTTQLTQCNAPTSLTMQLTRCTADPFFLPHNVFICTRHCSVIRALRLPPSLHAHRTVRTHPTSLRSATELKQRTRHENIMRVGVGTGGETDINSSVVSRAYRPRVRVTERIVCPS
jgi:hypothetical protein